ncbi:DHA2 family efflux MFS transporter permease subunit [Flexivirga oryzae]|uniref:EmrB/QacA subfamily drug resistance transporter n=1 Tax=Flexivirga oryzae TaxID=1794944 RepID=A0A839NCQ1_9MICO|nr:EmrB/QacA subfamily drug resistance transporter [Flexivirga oryzae]
MSTPVPISQLPSQQRADNGRWLILGVVCLAQLMVVLDATVVNIALPSAQRDLGFSDADRQWVVTAYSLAFGGLLLLGGRLSDLIGRERMLIGGMIGFACASALAGAATGFGMLIVGRAIQGALGAMLAPAALSTLTTTFTDSKERAKAFGVFGAIAGAGGAVGLVLGGLLTEYLDWRWTLFVNVVFALIAVPAALKLLTFHPRNRDVHIDVPGVVLASAGLVAIVYGFSQAESNGWNSIETYSLLIGGLVLLMAFVWLERRVAHPLLPMRIVTNRFRGGAYLTIGFSAMGMFAIFLFLTYFLQMLKGYSPVQTGLAFLPMIAALIGVSTGSSTLLATRVGPRVLIPIGLLVGGAGMAYLAWQLGADSSYVRVVLPALVIVGAGLGIVFSSAMNTATSGAVGSDAGVASAMVNTTQQVGGSIGTALLNTLAANALTTYLVDHAGDPAAKVEAAVHSYVVSFGAAAAIFAVAAIAASLVLPSGLIPAGKSDDVPTPASV